MVFVKSPDRMASVIIWPYRC